MTAATVGARMPVRVRMVGDLFHARLPAHAATAVYVGRAMPGWKASPYANRHRIGSCRACSTEHDRQQAITAYTRDLTTNPTRLQTAISDLAGRDLACWCPPGTACHGDVLLSLANHWPLPAFLTKEHPPMRNRLRYDLPGWPPAHDLHAVTVAQHEQLSAFTDDARQFVHDRADHRDVLAAEVDDSDDDVDEVAF